MIASIVHVSHVLQGSYSLLSLMPAHHLFELPVDFLFLAQQAQQFDQDVMAEFRKAFQNFVESGQIWALLIGLIIGYVAANLTNYN